MTPRNAIFFLLSATTLGACDFLDDISDDPVDSGITDDSGVADDSGLTDDTGDEPELDPGFVRFVNVADGFAYQIFVDDAEVATLYTSQSTDYAELEAGEHSYRLVNVLNTEVEGSGQFTVEEDAHYSFATAVEAGAVIVEDDLSTDNPVAANHTRLRFINMRGETGLEYVGQVYYDWGSVDQEFYTDGPGGGTLFIDPGESLIWEYPYAAEPIWIFGQWGVPTDEPQVAQEIDAYIQRGNGELVNVYLTCLGDCSWERPAILGQYEDSSTATTAGCQLYVNSGGSLTIEDCDR
ncbi:MAG: DUF4397 domain-containing protein [Alphaproteobacteria bacterium]|nr:DUF4397 domain-containing protein [Alphaproteobacteria bacterium]